jgi:hypothetical protein
MGKRHNVEVVSVIGSVAEERMCSRKLDGAQLPETTVMHEPPVKNLFVLLSGR